MAEMRGTAKDLYKADKLIIQNFQQKLQNLKEEKSRQKKITLGEAITTKLRN